MEKTEFLTEMARLENQWRNAYSPERKAVFFAAFKSAGAEEFKDAVSRCLASHRMAPMIEELSKEIELCRRSNDDTQAAFDSASGLLRNAAKYTKADHGFVKACIDIVHKREKGQLTKEQAEQAYDLLDETAKNIQDDRDGRKKCESCEDYGLVYSYDQAGHRFVARCRCAQGGRHSQRIPVASVSPYWNPPRLTSGG